MLVSSSNVVLTRIRIPFGELVKTMIIWGLAAFPALLVLYVLGRLVQVVVLLPLGIGAAAVGALAR